MLKAYLAANTKIAEFKDQLTELKNDESGASLVEYSILIGLITVAAILAIIAVGTWVSTQWGNLKTNLGA